MKNLEKQWLKIDQRDLVKPEIANTKGVSVKIMLSPSDVPTAVRYYTDETDSKLVVEFKYLTSGEKLILDKAINGAELLVGKHSRKIYKIAFDTADVVDNYSGKINIEMIIDAESEIKNYNDKNINLINKDVIDKIFKSKYIKDLGMA